MVENFDAYGERLADDAGSTTGDAKSRSATLIRIGQGVFWVLVIVIVLARLFYFSTESLFKAHGVQDPAGTAAR